MKLDPELLKQIIFAGSIGLLLFTIAMSVSLRRYKRRLLKLKKTERKLNCIKTEAEKANTIEDIGKITIKLNELNESGTYNDELSVRHMKISSYLTGKLDYLQTEKNKENEQT